MVNNPFITNLIYDLDLKDEINLPYSIKDRVMFIENQISESKNFD